ncbi:hypothetical protein FJZ53_02105 [Candidatus Woesearchaeota archaeon]|nr:hypothetical protein [Candidatus Woesearchaeota archaeon]
MPLKHRQDYGWFLLIAIMIADAYVVIKKGFLDQHPKIIIALTLAVGLVAISLIRLYLVTVGETALKHYSLARRHHKKYERYFKKGDMKLAEYYRESANKHRERAWKLEEEQGF